MMSIRIVQIRFDFGSLFLLLFQLLIKLLRMGAAFNTRRSSATDANAFQSPTDAAAGSSTGAVTISAPAGFGCPPWERVS